MNLLEANYRKLHNEIVTMKHMFLFSIILMIVIAIVIIYILKADIKSSMEQQHCHMHYDV